MASYYLIAFSIFFSSIEFVVQIRANQLERKSKRYLVHPDRCPVCTQPVGTCRHNNLVGMDIIKHWHYPFCGYAKKKLLNDLEFDE